MNILNNRFESEIKINFNQMKMTSSIKLIQLADVLDIADNDLSECMKEIKRKAKIYQSFMRFDDDLFFKVYVNETDDDVSFYKIKYSEIKEGCDNYLSIKLISAKQLIDYKDVEINKNMKQIRKNLIQYKQFMDSRDNTLDYIFIDERADCVNVYRLMYKEYKNKLNE